MAVKDNPNSGEGGRAGVMAVKVNPNSGEGGRELVWDNESKTPGNYHCRRCAGTGAFITGVRNGVPFGPGGRCFRCNGKGYHTQEDRRRNIGYDLRGRRA